MTIHGSYERHPDLGCEAIVFLDDETGGCFQIMRDLVGGPRADEYAVSTGASAPVYGGIVGWRRLGERFEFELIPRAGRLFGDPLISFAVAPADDVTLDDLAAHIDRLLR